MGCLAKIVVTGIAALVAAYLLPGVYISGPFTAILVAFVLAALNTFFKPVLVMLTIPLTIVTFGLFLLIINAIIVKMAAFLVSGFSVDSWRTAILFGLIVTVVSYVLEKIAEREKR